MLTISNYLVLIKKMILRSFFVLIAIIFVLLTSSVLAGEPNYIAIIQKQSSLIKKLTVRLNKLEQTVSAMQPKKNDSKTDPPLALKQEIDLQQTQEKTFDEIRSEYDIALSYLKDGKFNEAEEKFANFIQTHQKHKLRENAIFWYAESFYRRNNFNQSAINYLKCYKEYPKGSKAVDALLKLSLSLGNLNKSKEACSVLDKLDSEFQYRPANSLKRSNVARTKFGCKKK